MEYSVRNRTVSIFPPMGKERRNLSARIVSLSSPEAADARMGGTLAERVAAVMVLTEEAWRLSGRAFPLYTREATPVARGTLRDHAASL